VPYKFCPVKVKETTKLTHIK